MNLICFPHYTCGGLLCDILQQTWSDIHSNGGINSLNHRIGKIGDANDIFDTYNVDDFTTQLSEFKSNDWIGTHCWPGILADTSMIDQLIVITTTTARSKLYRWVRAYHHYYSNSFDWKKISGMERTDKERETAKNYIKPFLPVEGPNIVNIEFAEIVENKHSFQKLVAGLDYTKHLERWREINKFLYADNIWNTAAVLRFYEAELEVNLIQHYIYE